MLWKNYINTLEQWANKECNSRSISYEYDCIQLVLIKNNKILAAAKTTAPIHWWEKRYCQVLSLYVLKVLSFSVGLPWEMFNMPNWVVSLPHCQLHIPITGSYCQILHAHLNNTPSTIKDKHQLTVEAWPYWVKWYQTSYQHNFKNCTANIGFMSTQQLVSLPCCLILHSTSPKNDT